MIPVHKEPIGYTDQLRLIDLSNLLDVHGDGYFSYVQRAGRKGPTPD